MGFFNRLFNSNNPSIKKEFGWILLTDLQQLEDVVLHSYEKTITIFKHSTRCSISRFALNSFENEFNLPKEKMTCFYLDLLAHRDISNEVARKFQIEHQSPQILVIKNGKTVYSTSHESINAGILERFI